MTGFGKTLEEALQSLHDQLQLGPQNYTAVYDAQSLKNAIAQFMTPDTTMLSVTMPTFAQSLSSRPGFISTALPPVPVYGSQSVLQPVTTSSAKPMPEQVQSSSVAKTSSRDSEITFSALGTSAARPSIQSSILASGSHTRPANLTIAELWERSIVNQTAQSGVEAASGTLRMPEVSANAATAVSSFADFSPDSTASIGRKVVPQEKRAKDQDEQRNTMSRWFDEERSFEDLQEQLQNKSGLLKSYEYSRPTPFPGLFNSIGEGFTLPKPSPQNMKPAHASSASELVSAEAVFPSLQSSKMAGSFSRPLQTKDDVFHFPANSMSTMVSPSGPGKRKRDDTSYGASNLDAEQQLQKKIKIEEEPQTIKVEEQWPKKIKLEEFLGARVSYR